MVRGFKSRSEKISARYRANLKISLEEALPVRELASMLDVIIWAPSDVHGLTPKHIKQLTNIGRDEWSAVTIEEGASKLIIINPTHSEARLANDIAHELAHLILNHEKSHLEISESGELWLKAYETDQEEEADWLAASLLLPRDGLLPVYKRLRDVSKVAKVFGVSKDLAQMRINRTGIKKQLSF